MPRLRTFRVRPLLGLVLALIVLGSAFYAFSAGTRLSLPTSAPSSAPAASSDAAKLQARATSGAPAAAAVPAASPLAAAANGSGAVAVSPNASAPLDVQEQAIQPIDRMVIRTGQLVIEVGNMESALERVRQIAQQGGGIVSSSSTHTEKVNDQDRPVADLTIQVRSEAADTTLTALRGLGNVIGETTGSQDVTEEYVDLDSNLRNLQASESAIVKLMDKATRIEDVLALQRELTNVRGQIERIQGRKRYLQNRSDMTTISVSLRTPAAENARAQIGGAAWDPAAVAQRGWQASLTVLRTVAEVVIVVVAFSWWLVPLVGIGAYLWLQRRRPRGAAAEA